MSLQWTRGGIIQRLATVAAAGLKQPDSRTDRLSCGDIRNEEWVDGANMAGEICTGDVRDP